MKKIKNFLIDVCKGVVMGISALIPGVSCGAMAIVMKCYDKFINGISGLLNNFIKSILTILPIVIGMLIGAIGALVGIKYAFDYIQFSIVFLFIGMIIGSVPDVYKETKDTEKNLKYWLILLLSAFVVIVLGIFNMIVNLGYGFEVSSLFVKDNWAALPILIPVGLLASSGFIAPGISGSMILLVLGFYNPLKDTLFKVITFDSEICLFDFLILITFAISLLIGLYLISKVIKYLLAEKRTATFIAILGFLSGSIVAIAINPDLYLGNGAYPGLFNQLWEIPLGIVLGFLGFYITRKVSKVNNN